jgi:hypothetical protein
MPAEICSDCTSGTVLPTSVDMARAKREVSALRMASPSNGIFSRVRPTTDGPLGVRCKAGSNGQRGDASATSHHQSCTILLPRA